MITARIEENGKFVGFVMCFAQNGDPAGWGRYTYEYHYAEELGESKIEHVVGGEVGHYVPNGAAALMKEVFEDIETRGA